jgi:mycofactocin precursor
MSVTATESDAVLDTDSVLDTDAAADDDVLAELLVEEISIDGMCGVY